jgi:hypothetical protein
VHVPPVHHGVSAAHGAGLPHWPHGSQVCTPLPEHCLASGEHTGVNGHEQAPHVQLALHVCVPYELHDCEVPGVHPEQPPLLEPELLPPLDPELLPELLPLLEPELLPLDDDDTVPSGPPASSTIGPSSGVLAPHAPKRAAAPKPQSPKPGWRMAEAILPHGAMATACSVDRGRLC